MLVVLYTKRCVYLCVFLLHPAVFVTHGSVEYLYMYEKHNITVLEHSGLNCRQQWHCILSNWLYGAQ